jgi:hypothetical protein
VVVKPMSIWGSVYGVPMACGTALICLCAYQSTGDERLLDWARRVAELYLREPFPTSSDIDLTDDALPDEDSRHIMGHHFVPAADVGVTLELYATLYEISGEARWLDGALGLAGLALDLYCDRPIPRGAAHIDYYESQMGPAMLLHGLARVGLLARDGSAAALSPDFTVR